MAGRYHKRHKLWEWKTIYYTWRKKAHNIFRCEKWKYIKSIIQDTETDHRAYRTRQVYQKVNWMQIGYKRHERFLRNKDREKRANNNKDRNSRKMGIIF